MLVSEIPEYMVDWDYEQNSAHEISPKQVTPSSRIRVYWKCHVCGGKWNTVMKERRGCPYCTGFKALPGINDLATLRPDLAEQWDYERNDELTPQGVTIGSQKKVFWKCKEGHSWDAQVNSRVAGQGCPYCNNRRVLQGYNDLATVKPELAAEWDYSKNGNLTPCTVIAGSSKKVWWKCSKCGFEWEAVIGNRYRGNGCPSCSGLVVHQGKNDLQSRYPHLADEWDYDKNDCFPSEVAIHSQKKAYWICPKGHSYSAAVHDRVRGNGCPVCSRERRVSFPEKALLFYLTQIYQNVQANYRAPWLGAYELDIYLPEYRIGIEYDGIYGHSTKNGLERDLRKNRVCFENDVRLIRIREAGCQRTNSTSIDYIIPEKEQLETTITKGINLVSQTIGYKDESMISVNLERDAGAIYSLIEFSDKENSLQIQKPEIAAMWHPTKNGKLSPEMVTIFSSKLVWWKGRCGHEWRSPVHYEAQSGLCPYCSGKRVLIGFNDLCTTNPELAAEWDDDKNGDKTPTGITAGAKAKVWWKCKQGHFWKASVVSRNRGNGCPICANRVVLKGYNDVASFPDLVIDWDYNRNTAQPEEVCIGSEKRAWWKCHVCANEWSSPIADRYHGRQCPACAQRQRQITVRKTYVAKSGSLAELRPDLLREWDYEKNDGLQPSEVTPGHTKKVWWKCQLCGHSWQASVASRTRTYGGGCPKCGEKARTAKRREILLKRKEPLCKTHPELAAEWNYQKNTELSPDTITSGSGKRVWWKCSTCGNEWQAVVSERTRTKPRGKCPVCAIQKK